METILHSNEQCNLKKCQFCVSLFIGVHLYHSQVQNPVGITAVGYIELYRNLIYVCEYVKPQFLTLVL